MLYMMLITMLVLGFYASVTTSTTLARNDQRTAKALLAAESGIQFMRNRLAHVSIPPSTTPANLLSELETDLRNDAVIAGNLLGGTITRSGNVINIPVILADAEENTGFTVTITDIGTVGDIVCTVIGRTGSGSRVNTRGVRLDFTRQPNETSIFDNAVAAKGKLVMQKGSITGIPGVSSDAIAQVMSARGVSPAISMTGGTIGSSAGGGISVTDQDYAVITGGSVHGTSNLSLIYNHYLEEAPPPEFPVVNTDVFSPYATRTYSGGGGTLKNIRIPPNTNPVFTGNVTVQGILYIESPNTVSFRGNTTMAGFLVFENKNSSSVNVIDARGNFTYTNLPAAPEFDPLRAITGISMLAPTASLVVSGSVDSQMRGNLILGNFRNGGSADIQIEKGSLITMDTAVDSAIFNGKTVKFASTGKDNQPTAGLTYSQKFIPSRGSYLELN